MTGYRDLPPLAERCLGKWPGILQALGVPPALLDRKHHPCPFCGGTDRFRFTDFAGRGVWICGQCRPEAADGVALVRGLLGLDFPDAARRIEAVLDRVPPETRREPDEADCLARMARLWRSGQPITRDCPVGEYLAARGIAPAEYPKALRWLPALWLETAAHPVMLAQVVSSDKNVVNIHRTWLTGGGEKVRKLCRGTVPKGSAIRLGAVKGSRLGIAEGIETALKASERFEMPVWSCINAGNLESFIAHPGIIELVIFGDNDLNFVGQASAFAAARKNYAAANRDKRNLTIRVMIPSTGGSDWADADSAVATGAP